MCTERILGYLSRYGEKEAGNVPVPCRRYDNAIVIPCYDERPGCLDAVLSAVEGCPLALALFHRCPTRAGRVPINPSNNRE